MATPSGMPARAAGAQPHPMRLAMQARDWEALAGALAPDVLLRSPITSRFRFQGLGEIVPLFEAVREVLGDLRYVQEFGEGDMRVLVFEARVGGQEVQGTDILRLDEQGRVREITVFLRPLSGLTAFAAALAPQLARRRGRVPAFLLARLLGPVALLTRLGDPIATRLVRGRAQNS